MTTKTILIIDYGMGNLTSIANAIEFLDYKVLISNEFTRLKKVDKIILPGVGSFERAVKNLKSLSLDLAIIDYINSGKDILGICLGMQLLSKSSSEGGKNQGLGVIQEDVEKFNFEKTLNQKIPHTGFNNINKNIQSLLLKGTPENADFYFNHSYRLSSQKFSHGIISTCSYGIDFVAVYEDNNIFATQFHPEKSQTNGLMLLRNFLNH